MDSKKQPRKRITLVLRVELIDRVLEKARLLQQSPNNLSISAWKAFLTRWMIRERAMIFPS